MNTDLLKRLTAAFMEQMKEVISKASEDPQTGEHASNLPSAFLVSETDVEEKNPESGEPQRRRKISTKVIFKVYFSFEIPTFCWEENIDLREELPKRSQGGASNENSAEFFMIERLQNWSVEKRERCTNPNTSTDRKVTDNYYQHLSSGVTFRTKPEVIHFLLHGDTPSRKTSKKSQGSKKRKHGSKNSVDE